MTRRVNMRGDLKDRTTLKAGATVRTKSTRPAQMQFAREATSRMLTGRSPRTSPSATHGTGPWVSGASIENNLSDSKGAPPPLWPLVRFGASMRLSVRNAAWHEAAAWM